jgi:putative ABC transport system permease protein
MSWPGTPVHWTDLPDVPLNKRPIAVINNISSGYFQTLQIPLVRGRLFAESDRAGAVPVVVVNEALVRHFWPEYPVGVNPVGRRLLVGANPKPAEIVGIVRDIKLYPDSPVRPSVYRPYRQAPLATALLVRSDSPASIAAGVREQLRALDADQAFIATKTMDELLEEALGQRRLVLVLLQMFAGIAVVLSIVGTYGIINYAVAGRTREVGVRIALGARGPHIVRCLTGQGVSATAIGIVLGLGGAYGLTRFLRSYLFEVSPTEPTTFAAVALGFLAVAALSTSFPLRRALRIDPVIALRDE